MVAIKVNSKEKSTTIRLKETSKKMLEQLSKGKETHEEIILRLIKTLEILKYNQGTKLIKKGNILGTQYDTLHKTLNINIDKKEYSVVCTFNDLSIMFLMQNNSLNNIISETKTKNEWVLDLEITNIKRNKEWMNPKKIKKAELDTIYFICMKHILEEIFDLKLYQFAEIKDYSDITKWLDAYKKNNLSQDSLREDIKKRLK